ncbi:MAG: zinc ABC transporter substrate-binding protein [Chloroflexi bacterium]|nr:zinc ABC transporter substrate-binding protein [Chloroflexota bacterium]
MLRNLLRSMLLISLLLSACGGASGLGSHKLKVVATFSVLGDLAAIVGGDEIQLTTLAGPGVDSHTFSPTAADTAAVADADIVFENGLQFEPWLDALYTSSGSKAARVVVSKGITPLTVEDNSQTVTDPHIWHDVTYAVQAVRAIRDELVSADAKNATAYKSNAGVFIARLQELDTWVYVQVNKLPEDRRKLVTTHDSFGYLAKRYGFQIIGTVLPASTEGASPSAQQVAALVEAVKAAGVPAIFGENVTNNSLLQQVADEAGVKAVTTLYTDALGPAGSGGETYEKMMRSNVLTIVAALLK